ncbi:protease modulator HflK [Verrucomicrobia bacterium]|nr:protease modulator HflK [Verrucomicrobiota bacterium]
MNKDRNIQKIGLVNLVIMLIVPLVGAFVAQMTGSLTGLATAIFFGLGTLICAVTVFQMRLESREEAERLQFDELSARPDSSNLFQGDGEESLDAKRSRVQFERFFVPAFTSLLVILMGLGAWLLKGSIDKAVPLSGGTEFMALGFYALLFLTLFLLGKYSTTLSLLENQRLLRPGGSYMMLGALLSLASAAAQAASALKMGNVDRYVGLFLLGVLVFVAIELIIGLIFEIYRPRMKGQRARLLYESRLVGLLGQPGGIISTVSQALDYQFGFKVSDTWFYKFLERAFVWIVLLQLGVLFIFSMFVIIRPHEQALLERAGSPVGEVLEPGFHFKAPWPLDKIYRYSPKELQKISVGFVPNDEEHEERVLLWTKSHAEEEFHMLVANADMSDGIDSESGEQVKRVPVNLLTVSIPVHFVIKDLKAWAYNHVDGANLLEKIAYRETVRKFVNVDVQDVMSSGRAATSQSLKKMIQARADEFELGVQILFVGLQDVHPPMGEGDEGGVAAAYEGINSALQARETEYSYAMEHRYRVIPQAHAEAKITMENAKAYHFEVMAEAASLAARFTNQMAAYKASPNVFKERAHLKTVARAMSKTRKYVVAAGNTDDTIVLNLEEKFDNALLEIDVKTPDELKAEKEAKLKNKK